MLPQWADIPRRHADGTQASAAGRWAQPSSSCPGPGVGCALGGPRPGRRHCRTHAERDVEFGDGVRYREGLPFEDLGVLPALFAAATLVAETDAVVYGYRRHDASTEGGHQRLLKTDLLHVLALNIAETRAQPGLASVGIRRLVVGYVLHAAKSLEEQAHRASTRETDFDAAYRALVRDAAREIRRSNDLSLAYKTALGVSWVSPDTFVTLFGMARRLKARVLPQLRRT